MAKVAKKDQVAAKKAIVEDVPKGEDKPNTRKGPRKYHNALLDNWKDGQECELDMLNGTWVKAVFTLPLNGTMMCTVKLEDGTSTRVGRKFVRLRTDASNDKA